MSSLPNAPSPPLPAPVPRLTARTVTYLCGLFFLSRLLVLAVAALSHLVVAPGPYPRFGHTWVERFFAWDSSWYADIALRGYFYRADAQSSVGFYPLLPLLLRAANALGLNIVLAGYGISHAALLGACLLLWKLAAVETRSPIVAERAVLFLLFCPGAVWFGMNYTESLFLLTQLGCLVCARRGRWIAAGLWGMASALTRTPGVLLLGFLFLEGAQQWWEGRYPLPGPAAASETPAGDAASPSAADAGSPPRRWQLPARSWLARVAFGVAGPGLGQAAYLVFLQLRFGDWRAQQKTVTAGWNGGVGIQLPWKALVSQWHYADGYILALSMPMLVIMVGLGLISLLSLKRLGYPALVLMLCLLYISAASGFALTRYLSTIAPAYIVLGQLAARSQMVDRAALVFSVAMMSVVTILLVNGYLIN